MEALLVNVLENKVETVDVNGLEDYYKLLHCTTIDIVNRGINGKRYDIIIGYIGNRKAEKFVLNRFFSFLLFYFRK